LKPLVFQGIRVDRTKMFAFAAAGFCAALTGVLLTSLLGSGTLAAADGYLLDAFAAVFLGSATLREGQFHIAGTLIGVLVLAVGFNGLSIFGAPTYFQPIFKGGVLVLAVGLLSLARRYASAKLRRRGSNALRVTGHRSSPAKIAAAARPCRGLSAARVIPLSSSMRGSRQER
jgi:ribose/xylose/arabinose/galactoside ABC-type transport system permease subunit